VLEKVALGMINDVQRYCYAAYRDWRFGFNYLDVGGKLLKALIFKSYLV
jgi:hypothetical protein